MGGFFWIVIIGVALLSIFSRAAKKKQQEERRRAQQSAERNQTQRVPDDRFPDLDEIYPRVQPKASTGAPYYGGSLDYDSNEGENGSSTEGTAAYSTEGSSLPGNAYSTKIAGATVTKHVVRPLTESRHSHRETSLTGVEPDCMPDEPADQTHANAVAYDITESIAPAYRFHFDRDSVIQGVLYAEILGKPKALRAAGGK